MPAVLSKEVSSEVEKIIRGNGPILTRLEKLEELLTEHHLLKLEPLPVERLKTHKVNRSGLGVNPHEVHRLGQSVMKIGFRMTELDIWAVEAPRGAAELKSQFAFDTALLGNSKGLLAPLRGSEDRLMLAGNHMAQFLRAIEHGCTTPIPNMQDSEKRLDKHKLLKSGYDKPLAATGVPVKVIKQEVEEAVPAVATNSIQSECNEVEVMCSIAEYASMVLTWLTAWRLRSQEILHVLHTHMYSATLSKPMAVVRRLQ